MKKLTGLVVSTKNRDTAIVSVERFRKHPLYEKRVKRTKRYPVHDTVGVKVGDNVEFAPSRPYSKTKKWKIVGKGNDKSTDHGLQSTVKKAVVSRRKSVVKKL